MKPPPTSSSPSHWSLEGRRLIVTGASKGTGVPYAATKGALEMLTRELADEW